MEKLTAFFKKYLVLILCGIVVLGALGAGIWFLVNPEQPEDPDNSQTTESTGDLGLDTDMGFGELDSGSGIVNIPSSDKPSGEVNPITPDDKGNADSGEETPSDEENSGGENTPPDSSEEDTPSNSGNANQSQPVDMSGGVVANPF